MEEGGPVRECYQLSECVGAFRAAEEGGVAELCLMLVVRAGWFECGFDGGVRSASRGKEGHAYFSVSVMD